MGYKYIVVKTSRWDSHSSAANGVFDSAQQASEYMRQWIIDDMQLEYGEDFEEVFEESIDTDGEFYLQDNYNFDSNQDWYSVVPLIMVEDIEK